MRMALGCTMAFTIWPSEVASQRAGLLDMLIEPYRTLPKISRYILDQNTWKWKHHLESIDMDLIKRKMERCVWRSSNYHPSFIVYTILVSHVWCLFGVKILQLKFWKSESHWWNYSLHRHNLLLVEALRAWITIKTCQENPRDTLAFDSPYPTYCFDKISHCQHTRAITNHTHTHVQSYKCIYIYVYTFL